MDSGFPMVWFVCIIVFVWAFKKRTLIGLFLFLFLFHRLFPFCHILSFSSPVHRSGIGRLLDLV